MEGEEKGLKTKLCVKNYFQGTNTKLMSEEKINREDGK